MLKKNITTEALYGFLYLEDYATVLPPFSSIIKKRRFLGEIEKIRSVVEDPITHITRLEEPFAIVTNSVACLVYVDYDAMAVAGFISFESVIGSAREMDWSPITVCNMQDVNWGVLSRFGLCFPKPDGGEEFLDLSLLSQREDLPSWLVDHFPDGVGYSRWDQEAITNNALAIQADLQSVLRKDTLNRLHKIGNSIRFVEPKMATRDKSARK